MSGGTTPAHTAAHVSAVLAATVRRALTVKPEPLAIVYRMTREELHALFTGDRPGVRDMLRKYPLETEVFENGKLVGVEDHRREVVPWRIEPVRK
jgi:hypothetical protein